MDLQSGQVILHLITLMGSSKAKLQILHTLSFSSSSKSAAISALSLIDRAGICFVPGSCLQSLKIEEIELLQQELSFSFDILKI